MIKRMEKLEKTNLISKETHNLETKIGIYADPNGSGKTFTMLNLIKNDKMVWNEETIFVKKNVEYSSGGLIKKETSSTLLRLKPTLIVLAPALIPIWQNEIEDLELNHITINTKQEATNISLSKFDVVLVNTNVYNLLISIYPNRIWKRFVFDEPSYVKIGNMKFLEAGFYWLICSRPASMSIYHNTFKSGMMKTILGNNCWNLDTNLNDITLKSHAEILKSSFTLSKINNIVHECKVDKLFDKTLGISLPGKIMHYEEYENKAKIDDKCSICLSKMYIPTFNDDCSHLFCAECISNWLKLSKKCPLCKQDINKDNMTSVIKFNEDPDKNVLPTKHEKIISLLQEPTRKFLLWVDKNVMLDTKYIYNNLKKFNIKYQIFKGPISVKLSIINNFMTNVIDVLILNNEEDIPGINLQNVTDILLANNVKSDSRYIISKVNRIGIKHDINVHTFNILV
jgi:hypothetical protein